MAWKLAAGRELLCNRPLVMAILNATPDSFSDGGRLGPVENALRIAQRATADGADMLDIGGESTRPGADRVSADEQIRRVVPVIRAIREAGIDLPISVDTTLAAVAQEALIAGADAVNDVSGATEDPEMLGIVRDQGCGLVLMHRLKPPDEDSFSDRYRQGPEYEGGVVGAVRSYLAERLHTCERAGIDPGSVVLDPGLGFGKTVEQNLELIRATPALLELGRPVLSALSRKSFVGRISMPHAEQTDPAERLEGTLALSAMHLHLGAGLFRMHDVGPARRALDAVWALISEPSRAQQSRERGPSIL